MVLIRVEKKYKVDGGGAGDGSRSYFVEIDGGYILFREISGGGGEKSLEIARMIRKYLLDGVKGGGNFYIFLE